MMFHQREKLWELSKREESRKRELGRYSTKVRYSEERIRLGRKKPRRSYSGRKPREDLQETGEESLE